ncbi:MAG: hypothetical protein WC499_04320 [Patescibacteria group bacterium]
MEFKDKYSTKEGELYEKKGDDDEVLISFKKKVISDDAFALGDIIQDLINKIEHLRLTK